MLPFLIPRVRNARQRQSVTALVLPTRARRRLGIRGGASKSAGLARRPIGRQPWRPARRRPPQADRAEVWIVPGQALPIQRGGGGDQGGASAAVGWAWARCETCHVRRPRRWWEAGRTRGNGGPPAIGFAQTDQAAVMRVTTAKRPARRRLERAMCAGWWRRTPVVRGRCDSRRAVADIQDRGEDRRLDGTSGAGRQQRPSGAGRARPADTRPWPEASRRSTTSQTTPTCRETSARLKTPWPG